MRTYRPRRSGADWVRPNGAFRSGRTLKRPKGKGQVMPSDRTMQAQFTDDGHLWVGFPVLVAPTESGKETRIASTNGFVQLVGADGEPLCHPDFPGFPLKMGGNVTIERPSRTADDMARIAALKAQGFSGKSLRLALGAGLGATATVPTVQPVAVVQPAKPGPTMPLANGPIVPAQQTRATFKPAKR